MNERTTRRGARHDAASRPGGRATWVGALALFAIAGALGCTGDDTADPGTDPGLDAGTDPGLDAGTPSADAGAPTEAPPCTAAQAEALSSWFGLSACAGCSTDTECWVSCLMDSTGASEECVRCGTDVVQCAALSCEACRSLDREACVTCGCEASCVDSFAACSGHAPSLCEGPASCEAGARRCGADGRVERCAPGGDAWEPAGECPYVCTDGECVGECAPGNRDCASGETPRVCGSDGRWIEEAACASVCDSGSCVGECTPGARQCVAGSPAECGSDGTWSVESACPFLCSDGACTGECAPGAERCEPVRGNGVERCDESGAWVASGPVCLFGCRVRDGVPACNECFGDRAVCWGDDRVDCADGLIASRTTCGHGCESGACAAAPAPRTLVFENNLEGGYYYPNDWTRMNTIIRLRLGPTQTSVVDTEANEQLTPTNTVSSAYDAERIGLSTSRTFDVDALGLGTDYWIYVQGGWWECVEGGGSTCTYSKHFTTVVCDDCCNTCYKNGWMRVSHASGARTILATDLLPRWNYCTSGRLSC